MANIFTEEFEGGTDGAAITTGNTEFGYVSGSPTFSAVDPAVGGLCMLVAGSGYGSADEFGTRSTIYLRAYLKLGSLGAIAWLWNVLTPAPAVAATVRVNSNGTLRIMPGTSGTILETIGSALTANDWHRLEWGITPTTMQLWLFLGGNRHGDTPDYDSGPVAWSGGDLAGTQIGNISGTAPGDVFVDGLAADGATWVGSAVEPDPEPTETPHWFYDDGSAWVDVTGQVHHDNGATWTAL